MHHSSSYRMVKLIVLRELRDQLRDWRILIPIIILTVVLPFLGNAGAKVAINFTTRYGTPLIAERLVPFLMLVVGFFPITFSLVIALEAFVGEKERGTIEPLLASPLKDWHIYIGKLLSGTITPLATSYLGICVYTLGLVIQKIPLPDVIQMIQIVILTTAQAFLMVSGAILISTQSTSVRAANLLASFIVIPMALLIQGEAVMLFWGNDQILWLVITGVVILTLLIERVGIAYFQREALLGREIDSLNVKRIGQVFWHSFTGDTKNPLEWYRREIRSTLLRHLPAICITLVFGIVSALLGYFYIFHIKSSIPEDVFSRLGEILPSSIEIPIKGGIPFYAILGHNIQAILIISLLGLFSFATLGCLFYFINTAVIGVVLSLVGIMGYSPWKIALTGILPHGLFEIPAIVISSAIIVYGAVRLVTPNTQISLSDVLIEFISDWFKIFIGIVLPLLLVAAVIETWITPSLISQILK